MTAIANLFAGVLILFFGRRLYWVFVGAVGFVAGAQFASTWLTTEPPWLIILVAAGTGVLGAIASVLLQKFVLLAAGFVAGGYLGQMLVLSGRVLIPGWAGMLLGAVIGLLLVALLFNWALVVLSTLIGATVLASNAPVTDQRIPPILFWVAIVIGLFVQGRQMFGHPERKKES